MDVFFRSEYIHLYSRWKWTWDCVCGQATLPLRRGEPAHTHHCLCAHQALLGGKLLNTLFPFRDWWDIFKAVTHFICCIQPIVLSLSLPVCVLILLCLLLSSSIVKPDKIRISKVNTTVIEWSYPSSWSSPFSYFPLTFQIAQLKKQCRKCNNPCVDPQATKVRASHWYLNAFI